MKLEITKLNCTQAVLAKGNIQAAITQLQVFINRVSAYVKAGVLTEAAGLSLSDAANAAITQLRNGSQSLRTTQNRVQPTSIQTFAAPFEYALSQNYPNPFNPETEIRFSLPEASHFALRIFNTSGQEIRTLSNRHCEAGAHLARWDGRDVNGNTVSNGAYLYQLQAGTFCQTKKMNLLR